MKPREPAYAALSEDIANEFRPSTRHSLFCGHEFFCDMHGAVRSGSSGRSRLRALNGKERSDRFFKEYLGSPFTYITAAGAASGGQIGNDPREWTRSWEGYGKRVGTMFALFTIDTGVHEAGDAALGLDPRYFLCRCRGGVRRSWNAVEMSFLAYDGKGRKRFDLPQLAGAYGSGMIVTTWYPQRYDPLVQGVQMGHQQIGFVVGINLIREFSPELKRFFGKFNPR